MDDHTSPTQPSPAPPSNDERRRWRWIRWALWRGRIQGAALVLLLVFFTRWFLIAAAVVMIAAAVFWFLRRRGWFPRRRWRGGRWQRGRWRGGRWADRGEAPQETHAEREGAAFATSKPLDPDHDGPPPIIDLEDTVATAQRDLDDFDRRLADAVRGEPVAARR